MKEASTSRLMDVLKNTDDMTFADYEKEYLQKEYDFVSYMDELIQEKNVKRSQLFVKADIPMKYGYKLLTRESITKDRDKLLRIFIALGMSLKEVQRALSLYGMAQLYPKNRRDVILIICFNHGINTVEEVNEKLQKEGEEPLSACRDSE